MNRAKNEKLSRKELKENCQSRIADLRRLFDNFNKGVEDDPDGNFCDYGLCFDYVPAGTFANRSGYFRYQLSTGGPGDEFDFYCDAELKLFKIHYKWLDWYQVDTLSLDPEKEDYKLMEEIFELFREVGTVESELKKAKNN